MQLRDFYFKFLLDFLFNESWHIWFDLMNFINPKRGKFTCHISHMEIVYHSTKILSAFNLDNNMKCSLSTKSVCDFEDFAITGTNYILKYSKI